MYGAAVLKTSMVRVWSPGVKEVRSKVYGEQKRLPMVMPSMKTSAVPRTRPRSRWVAAGRSTSRL